MTCTVQHFTHTRFWFLFLLNDFTSIFILHFRGQKKKKKGLAIEKVEKTLHGKRHSRFISVADTTRDSLPSDLPSHPMPLTEFTYTLCPRFLASHKRNLFYRLNANVVLIAVEIRWFRWG